MLFYSIELIFATRSLLITTILPHNCNGSLLTISSTFDSLFRVLFIFPSRYLFAIGLLSIFSFSWDLPTLLGCTLKQPDSWIIVYTWGCCMRWSTGLSPSLMTFSKALDLTRNLSSNYASKTTIHSSTSKERVILIMSFDLFIRHY